MISIELILSYKKPVQNRTIHLFKVDSTSNVSKDDLLPKFMDLIGADRVNMPKHELIKCESKTIDYQLEIYD